VSIGCEITFNTVSDESWLSLDVQESFEAVTRELQETGWALVTKPGGRRSLVNAATIAYVEDRATQGHSQRSA
jgi:hypothetical protein